MLIVVLPIERAQRAVDVLLVLKIANGELKAASTTNPTCWKAAAPNVATNSRTRPEPKAVSVVARAPSTVSCPPETVVVPPAAQVAADQPEGSEDPENSRFTVGARITSPPAICETTVFAPVVPAEKSATVVSVAVTTGAAVVKLHVASAPSALPEKSVTVPATVTP